MNLLLKGRQGKTVSIEGNCVTITKKGWLFASRREKTIPIRNISSVEIKKPGLAVGFIQFSIAGGVARDRSLKMMGGAFDASKDENSVLFAKQEQYEAALKIRDAIHNWSPNDPASHPRS
jgi:hypothetical protein